ENEINRTNRDMKNLIYVTTHDLQIPLISIEGFANLLIRSCKKEKMSTESVEYLNRIIANTKSMTSLFKNFFDISKINSVKNPFEMIDVSDLIKKVISDKKYLTDKYGAKVKIDNPSSIKNIYGDKENIKLLYHHLIANAVIYGGKNIVIGYDERKGYYVKDDGSGIAESDLEKIFLPGERLNEGDILSSGMGLAFCRKTIEIHNGRIYAESEGKNKGTTVYFTLSNELIRD
ncbi:MAG: ATP-binding protein, partial [Candidatus Delongbacteria bacterium]